ncbi:hypothetical protein [Ktedonobacter racemifer]|uniref:hypothetical protein n=1 Tax=Ktedonobacter racemifer TaxID=363277 RepID=UPI0012FCA168|nr:hypothetical protein [Ktedonobacter racemifer]
MESYSSRTCFASSSYPWMCRSVLPSTILSEKPDQPGRASARVRIGNRAWWFLGTDHWRLQQAS